MSNWEKISSDEMKIGLKIVPLKKGELQIKYAKDIVAKDKEIERLNNKIKDISEQMNKQINLKTENANEIIRLNNIINEIEKYIDEDEWTSVNGVIAVRLIKLKLQELKGSDKE